MVAGDGHAASRPLHPDRLEGAQPECLPLEVARQVGVGDPVTEPRQPFVQPDLVGRVLGERNAACLTRRQHVPGLCSVVARAPGGTRAGHGGAEKHGSKPEGDDSVPGLQRETSLQRNETAEGYASTRRRGSPFSSPPVDNLARIRHTFRLRAFTFPPRGRGPPRHVRLGSCVHGRAARLRRVTGGTSAGSGARPSPRPNTRTRARLVGGLSGRVRRRLGGAGLGVGSRLGRPLLSPLLPGGRAPHRRAARRRLTRAHRLVVGRARGPCVRGPRDRHSGRRAVDGCGHGAPRSRTRRIIST